MRSTLIAIIAVGMVFYAFLFGHITNLRNELDQLDTVISEQENNITTQDAMITSQASVIEILQEHDRLYQENQELRQQLNALRRKAGLMDDAMKYATSSIRDMNEGKNEELRDDILRLKTLRGTAVAYDVIHSIDGSCEVILFLALPELSETTWVTLFINLSISESVPCATESFRVPTETEEQA